MPQPQSVPSPRPLAGSSRRRVVLALVLAATGLAIAPPASGQANKHKVAHMLRRTSFGVRAGQASQLSVPFPDAAYGHLLLQLQGNLSETPEYTAGLNAFNVPTTLASPPNYGQWTIGDLANQTAYRAAYSNNQLRELMTSFWSNLFNTDYNAIYGWLLGQPALTSFLGGTNQSNAAMAAAYMKFQEQQGFREAALGSFRDVLEISGRSPAMLIYLSNVDNKVPPGSGQRPNENYSREMMELHTLGVSPYSGEAYWYLGTADPLLLGYAFTGWGVGTVTGPIGTTWALSFDPLQHTDAPYTANLILTGLTISAADPNLGPFRFHAGGMNITGQAQGDHVYAYLSRAWETRLFICSKLIEFFVGYRPMDPNDPLVQELAPNLPKRRLPLNAGITEQQLQDLLFQCLLVWDQSGVDGNIPAVLTTIFVSPLFQGAPAHWTRIKSPLEYAASLVIAFDARLPVPVGVGHELDSTLESLSHAGQRLHRFPSPDGYPIESYKLASTSNLLHRTAVARSIHADYVFADPTGQWGGYTLGELDWYYLRMLLPGVLTATTPLGRYQQLVGYLQTYPPPAGTLAIGDTNAVVDHVLELLFQGDYKPHSRTLAHTHLQNLEAQLIGGSLQTLVLASNPNLNPNWPLTLQEHGVGLTRFLAYAGSLPQFQLK